MDQRIEAELAARLREALPQTLKLAYDMAPLDCAVEGGALPDLLQRLPSGFQVHLELEAALGAARPETFLLTLALDRAAELFGVTLPAARQLSNPDRQLQVLADLSEGTETLARALGQWLAPDGAYLALRVAGASLIESSAEAPGALAELAGFAALLTLEGGPPLTLVLGLSPALAESLVAGPRSADAQRATPRRGGTAVMGTARDEATDLSVRPGEPRSTARPYPLEQLEPADELPRDPLRGLEPILDVSLRLSVELGAVNMTIEEVLGLGVGSVVELDRLAGEPVDVVVNGRVIARGEVVVVDDNFGVRITEILSSRRFTAA